MKKFSIYVMAVLAICLTACDEDYNKHIADPQAYPQEEKQSFAGFTIAFDGDFTSAITIADLENDVLTALKATATPEVAEGSSVTYRIQVSDTEDFEKVVDLPTTTEDNVAMVNATGLDEAVKTLFGKVEEAQIVYVRTYVYILDGTSAVMAPDPYLVGTVAVTPTPPDDPTMYIIGSPWNWGWENVKFSMVMVNGNPSKFWSIQYFDAEDEIKFFPEYDNWENGIGYSEASFSVETAQISDAGGNIKIGKAGWYLVVVTVEEGETPVVEFDEPNVWLVGETSTGGWNVGSEDADKFTVPATADGEFISPIFKANNELRMCVIVDGDAGNWWKYEFMIFNNQIVYRGNDGDQERVNVEEGQRAYLNFSDNTGRIE
ncbi:MAG: SusF/SusE family outer membrane protein [Bacteroides sp.]|nr:SusF/SusE family outer membrane protein [Bacteroides sp.]